ncbi:MAG TPA: hypothetical protein DEQ14_03205 [Treponema sp.]|nr:hypothetical protein [Treponema sp.]
MIGAFLKKPVVRELKDKALFLGWIAGFVIISALLWNLSGDFLSIKLMRAVNRSNNIIERNLRLDAPVSHQPDKPSPTGIWYTLENSKDLFFVFTIMQDGIMILCGAQVTPNGKVVEIFPVSGHAVKIFDHLSAGIVRIYTRRIEDIAAEWSFE